MAGDRLVIVLAGPPGAGKSTWARATGLDRLSYEMCQRNADWFTLACQEVGRDPEVRLVVEVCYPDPRRRARVVEDVRADHMFILAPPLETVVAQILRRGRRAALWEVTWADEWYEYFEPDDPPWPEPPDPAQFRGNDEWWNLA